ncbi:hypothetical protein C8Q79DRAFT_914175, partial [Trametes meyenii]
MQPFLVAALIMVSVLHSLAHVAYPYTKLVLMTMKVVIFGALTMGNSRLALSTEHRNFLKQIPSDVRTVMKFLALEPDITLYATC